MQISREEVERTLASVVSEWTAETEPSLLERFFTWLGELFSVPEIGRMPFDLRWLVTLVFAALAAYLLVRIQRRVSLRGPAARDKVELDGLRRRVAELRQEARTASERGELTLALRLYVFALLLGLGERGDLHFRPAWTNRELLRRGEPGPAAARVLEPLVEELEPKEFGRVPTTRADIQRLEEVCDRMLGGPA